MQKHDVHGNFWEIAVAPDTLTWLLGGYDAVSDATPSDSPPRKHTPKQGLVVFNIDIFSLSWWYFQVSAIRFRSGWEVLGLVSISQPWKKNINPKVQREIPRFNGKSQGSTGNPKVQREIPRFNGKSQGSTGNPKVQRETLLSFFISESKRWHKQLAFWTFWKLGQDMYLYMYHVYCILYTRYIAW